jgi:TonB family protein
MGALLVLVAALAGAGDVSNSDEPIIRVGDTITEPRKLKHKPPQYPDDARQAGLGGPVVLECTIDPSGRVISAKTKAGPPPLAAAAIPAVLKWRYTPTLLNGKPVPVIMTVTVHFRHDGGVHMSELRESLRHHDEYIREAAANTLGRLGPQAMAAIPYLMSASNDESERVRAAASAALDRVRGKASR